MKRINIWICLLLIFQFQFSFAQQTMQKEEKKAQTFTNPLLPSGPDPWNIYHNGYYYYMHTLGNRLDLWKTKDLSQLNNAQRITIWTPPKEGMHSKEIWAPEIHFFDNKWYVYFAADDGNNKNHRLFVLENTSPDPMQGTWELKGKISDETDQWAIDGSVFEHKGSLYMIWSGWEETNPNREVQEIYIARLKNPYTVESKRGKISSPVLPWERYWNNSASWKPNNPVYVNEGPEILEHKDQLFLIYSASGCWTNNYVLGMLSAKDTSDLLDAASWTKYPEPVFQQSVKNKVYGTGHNSFFKSPDSTEDWILYHANPAPDQGCGNHRSPRAQKIAWKKDGTPFFGEPVAAGVSIRLPSNKKQ